MFFEYVPALASGIMGISGLLPLLSTITRPRHIRELAGLRAGIDGHVWLHRAVFANARAFAMGTLVDNHVKYFTKKCQYLLDHNVQPVVIFDGAMLPAKSLTNSTRSFDRAISMGRAIGLHDAGNTQSAYTEFAKAAEIKHQMVTDIVSHLRTIGVDAFVAPYETDAQLSFLIREGVIDFAISEDSDLLVYGCRRTLFKLDFRTGYGMEIAEPINSVTAFSNLSTDAVILACVLAGCDYGPSIRGVGIRKAIDTAEYCNQFMHDSRFAARQAVDALILRGIAVEDAQLLENRIRISFMVFKHQVVFDPSKEIMTHLNAVNPTDMSESEIMFLGAIKTPEHAGDVYFNRIDPNSIHTVVPSRNVYIEGM